ncbi:MAG: hypothetical protein A3C35_02930 [Omnitrophica bacterium RIFCSPHIGHO2_02_FULL_46_11]|nr:MAG: hypothetical protein A3C35_02930 [Omnitrophica bacterium RIFCSPHIGHO2_02_FULL_46_11]OGW84875.1 MAG: hypothetical protein A3A81_00960 [Omnitrophica bacterium RIFCSPLOWO2_01_FULL_45_10b]
MGQEISERVWSDFRVGIIAFSGLVILVLGITFAGGDKGLMFKKTTTVKARLTDVGGLKKGSSVSMSGMVVGKVADVSFVQNPQRSLGIIPEAEAAVVSAAITNQIEVAMEIRSDVRSRIKTDSIPAVRTQGMLGDRYIDIPPGSKEAETLLEGEMLLGVAASDFDKTLTEAIQVLRETDKMLSAVNRKEGTAGKLLYDEQFYNHLLEIASELDALIKDFKKNPRRYIKFSVF